MLSSRTVLRSCLVALSLATPLAFVAVARAGVACGDQTCPQRYECKAAPVACPDIACAPNDPDCAPPDCSGTVDTCVALACSSDSECGDGMVCYTSASVSACVPKYLLPCQTEDDCGAGFTCDEEQACGCSGSAGSGAPMADAGTPPPADCSCQPTGTKACNLKIVACSADSDCAAGFTCDDNPSGVCASDANGASACSADPAKICLPPYARLFSNAHSPKDATDTSGNSGSGSTSGSPAPSAPETSGAGTSPKSGADASSDGGGCSFVPARNGLGTSLGFAALALAGLAGARRRRAR
jgi:hypothetical protein